MVDFNGREAAILLPGNVIKDIKKDELAAIDRTIEADKRYQEGYNKIAKAMEE